MASETGFSTQPLLLQPPLPLPLHLINVHRHLHLHLVIALIASALLRLAAAGSYLAQAARKKVRKMRGPGSQQKPQLQIASAEAGESLLDLLCALLTLHWALLLRLPIRAVFAVGGRLLEGLGAADAVDVVLSTDY